jgi:hypothetical protein
MILVAAPESMIASTILSLIFTFAFIAVVFSFGIIVFIWSECGQAISC